MCDLFQFRCENTEAAIVVGICKIKVKFTWIRFDDKQGNIYLF